MECEEIRVDLRSSAPQRLEAGKRCEQLLFRLDHTMPHTEEYENILRELFGENLGEGSSISAPLHGACVNTMRIGRNVFINSNLLAMARGGITIEDHVMIAPPMCSLFPTTMIPMTFRYCSASRADPGIRMDRSRGDDFTWCMRWTSHCGRRRLRGDKGCSRLCSCSREPCQSGQTVGWGKI